MQQVSKQRATALYSMENGVPVLIDMRVNGYALPHPRTPPADEATFFAVAIDKAAGEPSYAVWSFSGQFKVEDALYIGDCPIDTEKLLALCFEANDNAYPQAILLY